MAKKKSRHPKAKRRKRKAHPKRKGHRVNKRLAIKRARRRIRELLIEGAMRGVREERAYVKRLQKL